MSESKHTPEPWSVHREGHVALIRADSLRPVCGMARKPGKPLSDEGEANARLIAAAPDLLAACREALQITLDTAEATGLHRPALVCQLERVIAKATQP